MIKHAAEKLLGLLEQGLSIDEAINIAMAEIREIIERSRP